MANRNKAAARGGVGRPRGRRRAKTRLMSPYARPEDICGRAFEVPVQCQRRSYGILFVRRVMRHEQEIESIIESVKPWPQEDRVALAYLILRDMRKQTREPAPRHTLQRALGIARG